MLGLLLERIKSVKEISKPEKLFHLSHTFTWRTLLQQFNLGLAWADTFAAHLKPQELEFLLKEITLLHIERQLVLDHPAEELLQVSQVVVSSFASGQNVVHISMRGVQLERQGVDQGPKGIY